VTPPFQRGPGTVARYAAGFRASHPRGDLSHEKVEIGIEDDSLRDLDDSVTDLELAALTA
jgi:hypothetical protein